MSSPSHISTSVVGETAESIEDMPFDSPSPTTPAPSSPAPSWVTTSDVIEQNAHDQEINAAVLLYTERMAFARETALRFYAHLFIPYRELLDELRERADASTFRILRLRLEILSSWYDTRNAAEQQMEGEFRRIDREHRARVRAIRR